MQVLPCEYRMFMHNCKCAFLHRVFLPSGSSPPSHVRTLRCSALVDHSAKFTEAAKHVNLIPLYRSIFSDHLIPVLAYWCLVKEDERDTPSFLFELVEPGL